MKKKPKKGKPAPKGDSGPALAGEDGAELDSLRGDVTNSAGGRSMVMLRVTASTPGDGEKEAYLRSLPRPESGRGPATVSSHSWSRRPMHRLCTYVPCAFFYVRVFSSQRP
jgi:hypothetical protein